MKDGKNYSLTLMQEICLEGNEKTFRDRGSGFVVRLINIDDFTTDQSAKKTFKKNNYFFYFFVTELKYFCSTHR